MSILFLRRQYNWIPFLFIFTLFSIFIIIIFSSSYDLYMQNQKYENETSYYLSLEKENLKLISINKQMKIINEDNQKQIQQLLIEIENFKDNLGEFLGIKKIDKVKKVFFEKTVLKTELFSYFKDSLFEIVNNPLKLYLKKIYYDDDVKKLFIEFYEFPQELNIDFYYYISQQNKEGKTMYNIFYNPKLNQIKFNIIGADGSFYL